MKAFIHKEVDRFKDVQSQKSTLSELLQQSGDVFPGSDYRPPDRKNWMAGVGADRLRLDQIVWPGTHDSATNDLPIYTRPFAMCQELSIYEQLVAGTRVLDIRVNQDRRICHGIVSSYDVDVVFADVKRFLEETSSEFVILEIRTEFGHEDPPEFDKHIVEQLGEEHLVPLDEAAFGKTVAELLPRRVICVWKPRKSEPPKAGDPLWSAGYLRDNWIDTDLPETKFESNMKFLGEQPPAGERKYFYRVENTATPQADNPVVFVKAVTERIHGYARLFISQAFAKGLADRLQVFSTDFIDGDFVDACAGVTHARLEGKA